MQGMMKQISFFGIFFSENPAFYSSGFDPSSLTNSYYAFSVSKSCNKLDND